MQQQTTFKIVAASLLFSTFILTGCSDEGPTLEQTATDQIATENKSAMSPDEVAALGDTIARVGDQAISFNQINTMLNSSAVVGVSVPALGTPERDTARIVVLDKVISANLLYLDAIRKGLDKDPAYQRELQNFSDGMLGSQYYRNTIASDIPVTDEEIRAFFDRVMEPGTEMTEEVRIQIEATLRKRKLHERLQARRAELRTGIDVRVYPEHLGPVEDKTPADDAVVAKYGDKVITWGEASAILVAAGRGATRMDPLAIEADAQLDALQAMIDKRILADKAREAGLEKDPMVQARLNEYRKTRLVNLHRASLAQQMEPTEEQLRAFYDENRNSIMQVEMRKLQEVMLPTREEAQAIKARVDAGELTMFQAAANFSKAPGARLHLGEVGWIAQGRAQPTLDEVIFKLQPGEIGGPVESTEGWHLFKVLDVTDARFDNFDDAQTRKLTRRRYIHSQLDQYVQDLRKNAFEVAVYQDNIVRLAQLEADMVAKLLEQAAQPGSKTEQRIEELNKLIGEQ